MLGVKNILNDLLWIGVNEKRLNLFENIHPIPNGVSCNSYVLLDEKTVLFDTVDKDGCDVFLSKLERALNGKTLDYLVIHHVEPDHAYGVKAVINKHKNITIISSMKAFTLLEQFNINIPESNKLVVTNNSEVSFGSHSFTFITAPMVHWPEVLMSFDSKSGVLFSADAFGTFGTLDGKIFNDEFDYKGWLLTETRRYYTNIVGRYGNAVNAVLKKASGLDIKYICPLHGPVWRTSINFIVDKYNKWANYIPEKKGVVIIYGSMYGNTEGVAQIIASEISKKINTRIEAYDVSLTHPSDLVAKSFKYSHIIVASPTYNENIYPQVHDYLNHLQMLKFQGRTFAVVENGSWNSLAGKLIREYITNHFPNSTVIDKMFSIKSSLKKEDETNLLEFVDEVIKSLNSTNLN